MSDKPKGPPWWAWVLAVLLIAGAFPVWWLGLCLGWRGFYSGDRSTNGIGHVLLMAGLMMFLIGFGLLVKSLVKLFKR